jgi:hypothetical protein
MSVAGNDPVELAVCGIVPRETIRDSVPLIVCFFPSC